LTGSTQALDTAFLAEQLRLHRSIASTSVAGAALLAATMAWTVWGSVDASRLLADASLILQRTTGVVAEPVLSRPGMAVAEAAREAGTLVVGLAEQRPQDGLGQLRAALAAQPPARLLFVHRGARPSGVAPEHQLSSFAWSIARERIDRR